MKWLISILSFFFITNTAIAQPFGGSVRIRDGNGTGFGDVETDAATFADDTFLGQVMLDFNFIHDGSDWQRVVSGAGAVDAGTQRVTLANDDPAVTAVEIMDDWDESDRAAVNTISGQTGVEAGTGAVTALTQRMTLANDDPAVTAVEIMDDWDESDRAAVNLISGQSGVAANTGSASATTVRVVEADDGPVGLAHAQADDDQTDVCTDLTAASQQYTIPSTGDYYCIKAIGNTAYILGGSDPTATTSANGHVYPVSDGERICVRINSAKVAFIADSAAGEICFLRLNSSL